MNDETKKSVRMTGLSFNEVMDWIESNLRGFYLGCRVEPHSPQVSEFVDCLHVAMFQDFGFKTEKCTKLYEEFENKLAKLKSEWE